MVSWNVFYVNSNPSTHESKEKISYLFGQNEILPINYQFIRLSKKNMQTYFVIFN